MAKSNEQKKEQEDGRVDVSICLEVAEEDDLFPAPVAEEDEADERDGEREVADAME